MMEERVVHQCVSPEGHLAALPSCVKSQPRLDAACLPLILALNSTTSSCSHFIASCRAYSSWQFSILVPLRLMLDWFHKGKNEESKDQRQTAALWANTTLRSGGTELRACADWELPSWRFTSCRSRRNLDVSTAVTPHDATS